MDDVIREWRVVIIDGREEGPPKLDELESVAGDSVRKVGKVEGDGDIATVGMSAMDGGGRGLKRGGKGSLGWQVNSKG